MVVSTTKVPKVDYRRELGDLYDAREEPSLVDVPTIDYLMVDGHGDPNGSTAFAQAVEALCAVGYALKFRVRKLPDGIDFAVMPLEGSLVDPQRPGLGFRRQVRLGLDA